MQRRKSFSQFVICCGVVLLIEGLWISNSLAWDCAYTSSRDARACADGSSTEYVANKCKDHSISVTVESCYGSGQDRRCSQSVKMVPAGGEIALGCMSQYDFTIKGEQR